MRYERTVEYGAGEVLEENTLYVLGSETLFIGPGRVTFNTVGRVKMDMAELEANERHRFTLSGVVALTAAVKTGVNGIAFTQLP